jgi:hypothetical protein
MDTITLEQAVKAESESSITLFFFEPRRWKVVGDQHHVPVALPLERDPVVIAQEAGWVPGPV